VISERGLPDRLAGITDRRRIGVVQVRGAIGGAARTDELIRTVGQARRNGRIRAVLLEIDSPGGTAIASEQLYVAVRRLAARKPVVAWIKGVGASGAYFLACAATRVLAFPSALVGSIGVISVRPVLVDALRRAGARVVVTKTGPFKDLGAIFIAHQRAKQHLEETKYPEAVIPDLVVDDNGGTVELGGTTIKLVYVGRNHSDNSLVMYLPKEKLIFTVDIIRIRSVQFRNMPDTFPLEFEESIKKMLALDWDRMIPGHPGPGGRLGTKDDAREVLGYIQDLSAATKKAADEGKCFDAAMKEVKLPKYESWANYAQYLPGNVERYCMLWGRGT